MKISGIRKILIICLSLILAMTAALFATQYLNHNSYAQVSPDGLSAYDEGDEGQEGEGGGTQVPDQGAIATPDPFDDPDDFDWEIVAQQVTLEIGKLVIRVEYWDENGISTKAHINPNPDGIYDARPDLVEKIESLLNSDFIVYSYWDVNGNELTADDVANLLPGHTVFIHVDVNEEYRDSVSLLFKDGIPHSYAYRSEFPASQQLTKVPPITDLLFEFNYVGTSINLEIEVVNKILMNRDAYLMFVASESATLIQNGAGEFYLTFCFKDGVAYCWDSSTPYASVVIKVVIHPYTLEATVTDLGEYTYTGYEQDVIAMSKEFVEAYGDYVVVAAGYTSKGKDAGEYIFHIIINPVYGENVKWAEGVQWAKDALGNDIVGHVEITWTIVPAVITGDWGPKGEYGRITITSESGYVLQATDIEYIYTDIATGEIVASSDLEVGKEYEVEVVLKTGNLVWSSDPGKHRFTLTRQLVELSNPEINYPDGIEYTGYAITFIITIDGVSILDAQFAEQLMIVEELSDSLTQTNAGKYKVVIRLIDDAVSWAGNITGDFVIEFEITAIVVTVNFDATDGTPTFKSNWTGDYSNVASFYYLNSNNERVSKADMKKGEYYITVVEILDKTNFNWDNATLQFPFQLQKDFIGIDIFVLSQNVFDYTGSIITVTVTDQTKFDEYIKNGYIEIVSGSFRETNAGTYTIVIKIKDHTYFWKNNKGDEEYLKLTFTINKIVLKATWDEDGRLHFDGVDYNHVLEYEYRDADGNIVAYEDLVEGQTYTVTVRLKDGMSDNFDDSQLQLTYTIKSFKRSDDSDSPSLWWLYLIIALVVLAIIIIIIIIIIKKRNKDDEYDDFYGDEYYGDEGEGAEGDEDGAYDDYGDLGDYGGDDFGGDYGGGDFGDGSGSY